MGVDVLLLRHGETELNWLGALRGHIDVPLNDVGHLEARLLASRVASEFAIAAVYSSPLKRAKSTAAAVARAAQVPLQVRRGWIDVDWGPWAGKLAKEFDAEEFETIAQWCRDPSETLPGAETALAVARRAMSELHELGCAGSSIAVVSHDAVIQIVLCKLLGLPLATYRGLVQSTATLNLVRWNGLSWSVELINSNWHLDTVPATAKLKAGSAAPRGPRHEPRLTMTAAGGVVIDRGGQILALRTHSGDWVLPKGKLRIGEAKAAAAAREVREETGVEVEVVSELGVTSYAFYEDRCTIYKSVHWFLMRGQGSLKVRPGKEFAGLEWLPPAEAIARLKWDQQKQVAMLATEAS